MNILLISLFGEGTNSRVNKIKTFAFPDDNVTIITSNFNHGNKSLVEVKSNEKNETEIIRLPVPPYNKNISLRRIYSHLKFAIEVKKYLNKLKDKPDLIYCAMPTSSTAVIAGKYCKRHKVPFVIDVIDLWPDSLIPIVKFKFLIKFLIFPWSLLTREGYKLANYISGESQKYTEVAQKVNPNVPHSYTYLGVNTQTTKDLINSSQIMQIKPHDEIWIAYGGSLGNSYDFDVILEGLKELEYKNIKYKMWFIGGGEKEELIRHISQENNLNVEITGRIPYADLLKYLSFCDIAINSFKEETLVVHSYKFNDYVATGCYIMNNLTGETGEMINKYKIGCNFNSRNFSNKLLSTITNWSSISKEIKYNINNLIAAQLETSTIYRKLGEDIKRSCK